MTLPIWAKPGYLSLSIWPRVNFQSNQFLKDVWQSVVPSEHSQSAWWGHGRNPFTPANDLSSCTVRATCLWGSPFFLPLNILFQQCASLPCRKKKKDSDIRRTFRGREARRRHARRCKVWEFTWDNWPCVQGAAILQRRWGWNEMLTCPFWPETNVLSSNAASVPGKPWNFSDPRAFVVGEWQKGSGSQFYVCISDNSLGRLTGIKTGFKSESLVF